MINNTKVTITDADLDKIENRLKKNFTTKDEFQNLFKEIKKMKKQFSAKFSVIDKKHEKFTANFKTIDKKHQEFTAKFSAIDKKHQEFTLKFNAIIEQMNQDREINTTRFDAIMGELKSIREEHAIQAYQLSQSRDNLENHETRISTIEEKIAF